MATSAPVRTALQTRLTEYVDACFTGIYVQTNEFDEALREIREVAPENDWIVHTFDLNTGHNGDGNPDAVAAVRSHYDQKAIGNGAILLVIPSFNRLLANDLQLTQAVQHAISAGKDRRTFIVILSPTVQLPVELEKSFVTIEHALPDRETLLNVLNGVASSEEIPSDDDGELTRLLDAAAGLTRYEAEGAFSLSLARHAKLDVSVLWELKQSMLKKTGTLELYRGNETFDDLGGLDGLKTFCKRALLSTSTKAKAKGVLLLGVAGGGKSAFAKALGTETSRPTVMLDFGALMGGLVGQTEENTRRALAAVDAMAPCILFCDEIEKGLSGATGGHNGDSGVSSRMLGTLLTWLNDHTSDVFFVGTCNDISKLSQVSAGAFTRAERFDGIFFIDLPSAEQRDVIWDMYLKAFDIVDDVTLDQVDDTNWTGAEIKSCCRLASLLGITFVEASKNVVPVAKSSSAAIAELRSMSEARGFLDANRSGAYQRRVAEEAISKRRVVRAK
mgnify:CR=1 FL=1